MLEKLFKLKENNTTVKTEIAAGITTFMTMAYILAVNPSILSEAGMNANAVLIATCLASFIGTMLMALLANLPFALSAGMGLNAYFTYTVVIGSGGAVDYMTAFSAVFVAGIPARDVRDQRIVGGRGDGLAAHHRDIALRLVGVDGVAAQL